MLPARADVEVDGAKVTAMNGAVAIEGAIGSAHHVRISMGKHDVSADVVIAESGGVPSQLELPVQPQGGHANNAASAQPPLQQGIAPPPPPPPSGTQPGSSATPAIVRSFN